MIVRSKILHSHETITSLRNFKYLFLYFILFWFEMEGRHANAKALEAVDHLASIMSNREEIP